MGRRRPRRRALLAAALLLSLAAALLVVELVLRAKGPYATFGAGTELPWMRNNPSDLTRLFTIDPEFGFRPILGQGRYNEWGTLQNPYALEKPPGVTRLLFLGDSVVARGKVVAALAEVYGTAAWQYWNAGVESYGTVQEVNFYKRFNAPLAPDHVLLWFHVNDFQTTPVAYLDDEGRLVVYAPGRALEDVSPFWFEHSHLYRLLLGLTLDERSAQESIAAEIQASLVELQALLARDGIAFTVVVLPLLQPLAAWTPEERAARERILAILAEQRIRSFDLLLPLEQALEAGEVVQEEPGDIWHPSQGLSQRFARHLAAAGLLELPADAADASNGDDRGASDR